jgi:hypothetical protein
MHGIPRISLLFALIGLALTACSSTGKAKSSVASPARYVLPNGARVLIQEYPSSEVVAVQLWVRAGGAMKPQIGHSAPSRAHALPGGLTREGLRRPRRRGGRGADHRHPRSTTRTTVQLPAPRVAWYDLLADIAPLNLDSTELGSRRKTSSRRCGWLRTPSHRPPALRDGVRHPPVWGPVLGTPRSSEAHAGHAARWAALRS